MKHILMIATGGTIASRSTDSGLTPLLSSEDLLRYIPRVSEFCTVTTVQPFNLDSTNITPAHWLELARIIREESLNPEATREFIRNAFRENFLQVNGTALSKVLPPVSCFTPTGDRARKRETVLEKLSAYFERFREIAGP